MGRFFKYLAFISIFVLSACLTEEEQQALNESLCPGGSCASSGHPGASSGALPQCFLEQFRQPPAQITRNIDLLFVTDTSGSLNYERTAIADGVDAFIDELPSEVDLRVAVTFAHGEASPLAGSLVQSGSEPAVLDSNQMTNAQIRTALRDKLTNVTGDVSTDGGEAGVYALNRLMDQSFLSIARSQDFFRRDAALAIVFISDENDICAIYPSSVQRVPDPDQRELPAFQQLCVQSSQLVISKERTLQRLQDLQDGSPLLVSAIIYNNLATVPSGGENEFGYGYADLVTHANGLSVDIAGGNYNEKLAEIGRLATIKLNLIVDFTLARTNVEESSISAKVDGQTARFTYNSATNVVHLLEPGQAESLVELRYCLKNGGSTSSTSSSSSSTSTSSGGSCSGPSCGGMGV